MRTLDIALKDLRQLVLDWKSAVFLVLMPILFTLLFGFAFGGFGGGEEDPRLPVGVLDRDGGAVSRGLLGLLGASEVVRPVVLDGSADVAGMVREGDLAAVVIVPQGYGARLLAGEVVPLPIVVDEGSPAGMAAQGEVWRAAARLLGAARTALLTAEAYAARGGEADEPFLTEAMDRAIAAWQRPSLTVEMTEPRDRDSLQFSSGFTHTSPSMIVQFAIAGLIGVAELLVLERKSGTLRRLLTTVTSRAEIIVGHWLAMFVMLLFQFTLLIGFGQLALRVDYLREPAAIGLLAVVLALWASSLGLLIGTLAKTEEQATILALLFMFLLSGLGGAWVPLEYTGEAFRTIGHLMPTAWAMDGFHNIVARGLGLESVLLPAAVLLAYAALFFGLAAWRFPAKI